MFSQIRNRLLRYTVYLIYIGVLLFCAIEMNFLGLFGYSPTAKAIKSPVQHFASELYTADSVLIGRYFREDRTPVQFEQLPQSLIDALIATEDIRFYKHHGVDGRALLGSLVSTAKGDKRGGSTLTQQLAK